jgi:hypothetical protein
MEVSQHGPTDAFNVVAWGKVVFGESKAPPPMANGRSDFFPHLVKGGDRTPIPLTIEIYFANEDQLDSIRDETLFAHLFGEVTYDDVFGRSHRTPFRYMWEVDGETVEGQWVDTSGWIPWGSPEDNRAT